MQDLEDLCWKLGVSAKTLYHNRGGGQGVRLSILPPIFTFLPPLFSFLPPRFTFLPSLCFLPSSPFSRPYSPFSHPFSHFSHLASPFSLPSFFSSFFSFLPPLVSFLPVSLYTVRPLITDTKTGQKKQYTSTFRNFVPNLPVSAILV